LENHPFAAAQHGRLQAAAWQYAKMLIVSARRTQMRGKDG
jgi:hypothetical protein